MKEVFVVEIEHDDPYYGYKLHAIYASEEDAKAVSQELTKDFLITRYRKITVLGS